MSWRSSSRARSHSTRTAPGERPMRQRYLEQALEHLAKMNIKPERKFIGRAKQRIAFVSDPDGNSIELMEIPPESEIYRDPTAGTNQ